MNKKIAVVVHGIPHPTEGASAVVFYWYIKALKDNGYNILCIIIGKKNIDSKSLTSFIQKLGIDDRTQVETLICDQPVLHHPVFGPKEVDKRLAVEVASMVNTYAPSMLIGFDLIASWSTQLCKVDKKIAWLGDLNFQTYWYHIFYAIERGNFRSAFENFLYFHPWKKCYQKALSNFSNVIVCAASSIEEMEKIGIKSEYLPYPWPSEERIVRRPEKIPNLAFFGSLAGLGSLSAINILIKQVYPNLISKYGARGFKIKVFGRGNFPEYALKIIKENPEFEMLGYVSDIRPLLASCHALIVPISVPVGNRTRIITAFSHEIPVIAHKNTSLGNPDLLHGVNCLLGQTGDEMASHFYRIYADRKLANDLAKNGRKTYEERNLPPAAAKLFIDKMVNL